MMGDFTNVPRETANSVILHDARSATWLRFHKPRRVIEIRDVGKVKAALTHIETEVIGRGLHAAGFLSYEAGPAFDDALGIRARKTCFPLLWFGLYEKPDIISLPERPATSLYHLNRWNPSVRFARYKKNIETIKKLIAAGETYQVNYTFKMKSGFSGNPWDFFLDIEAGQQAQYSAFVDTGRFAICSASPELFFSLRGSKLESRPMKGTAARAQTCDQDERQSAWLASSEKNRAENIMIVDNVRNDMGRIARPSTVCVPRLFECERFPTVWQMTSTVSCRTREPVAGIIASLFPCASITGAPKVSTTGIFSRLEEEDRGVYTGCIGYIAPHRKAQFNVAIRTAVIDKQNSTASYGVGGGIVWQSDASDEYAECLVKAAVLTNRYPPFSLLETMLWTPRKGYFLLGSHMKRLCNSASYFGFAFDTRRIRKRLAALAASLSPYRHRVRLLVDKTGGVSCEAAQVEPRIKEAFVRLGLSKKPVDTNDCFLYHKTTNRQVCERAMAGRRTSRGDVLLFNEREEITETSTANIVIELDKRLVTPPVECGLLAGTMRRRCLARGEVCEKIVHVRDLRRATAIYTINSVRKWQRAVIEGE
jgi:para-aminobenzoate synthetase / 4-amino-4-deoxychorismate lyase